MTSSTIASAEYERQQRLVLGLRAYVFQSPGGLNDNAALAKLATAEQLLSEMRQDQPVSTPSVAEHTDAAPVGRRLSAATTRLDARVTLCMQPIPTGIYRLLDPVKEPLLQVDLTNVGPEPRRVLVKASLQGLSAESAATIELGAAGSTKLPDKRNVKLSPALLPGAVERMTDVQRAMLAVTIEELGKGIESYDTYSIVCLSRNSSFNSVRDPATGQPRDLTRYYGAWVTPYDDLIQERIRVAASSCNPPQLWGYQGKEDSVEPQVRAIFDSLKSLGMTYINSVVDFGAPDGLFTQRTRLPCESLRTRSANCIDGTVLMASLLEGISLNPAIVLIPGHALVAWQAWEDSERWSYLETTMLGTASFEEAVAVGERTVAKYRNLSSGLVIQHALTDLRAAGIWPMG